MTVRRIHQSPKLPADQRRDQLLNAALLLLMRDGYRATTTDAIARQAGLTKGAIYFHFKSKEDILCQLMKRYFDQFKAALQEGGVTQLSPGDVLRIIDRIHRHQDIHKTSHTLDMWASMMRVPRIRRYVNQFLAEASDIVAARLDPRFGRTLGERREVELLSFALYDGWMLRTLAGRRGANIERQIRVFEKLITKRRKGGK